jgi:FMN phosphatase YigB (HAD superfamily)
VTLDKLGLNANECIYIDDYDKEVEGALNLGFKGFRINRNNTDKRDFDIHTLKEIINVIS